MAPPASSPAGSGQLSPSAACCTRCSSHRPFGSISDRRWHWLPCWRCIHRGRCASSPFQPTRSNILARWRLETLRFQRALGAVAGAAVRGAVVGGAAVGGAAVGGAAAGTAAVASGPNCALRKSRQVCPPDGSRYGASPPLRIA
jgi:hypothetical protein